MENRSTVLQAVLKFPCCCFLYTISCWFYITVCSILSCSPFSHIQKYIPCPNKTNMSPSSQVMQDFQQLPAEEEQGPPELSYKNAGHKVRRSLGFWIQSEVNIDNKRKSTMMFWKISTNCFWNKQIFHNTSLQYCWHRAALIWILYNSTNFWQKEDFWMTTTVYNLVSNQVLHMYYITAFFSAFPLHICNEGKRQADGQ